MTGDTGPGTSLRDLLPIPAQDPTTTTTNDANTTPSENAPSLSHALATDDHAKKGHAQEDHEEEVLNLGWNEPKQEIAAPLVGGMDNEDLWLLIRRFNKVSSIYQRHDWSPIAVFCILTFYSKFTT